MLVELQKARVEQWFATTLVNEISLALEDGTTSTIDDNATQPETIAVEDCRASSASTEPLVGALAVSVAIEASLAVVVNPKATSRLAGAHTLRRPQKASSRIERQNTLLIAVNSKEAEEDTIEEKKPAVD